jgi:glutathione S-transferase
MDRMKIVLGNKAYSSWSMRPWIALKLTGVDFDEEVIPLDREDTAEQIGRISPSKLVPVLIDETENVIWESLAIIEYLAERFPDVYLWPKDAAARAMARCVSSEMHAGFHPLRQTLPMNLFADTQSVRLSPAVQGDISRMSAIFTECRSRFGKDGPFLFGERSAADAMFAPAITRFKTYGVHLDDPVRAYAETILDWDPVVQWYRDARDEPLRIAAVDQLVS